MIFDIESGRTGSAGPPAFDVKNHQASFLNKSLLNGIDHGSRSAGDPNFGVDM
jgi:hypothetical protein